jgi:hypothetical protein
LDQTSDSGFKTKIGVNFYPKQRLAVPPDDAPSGASLMRQHCSVYIYDK